MKHPRIMIAGQSSGSGKTLITSGLLQALVNRKLNVSSFKCGPDYIDPMFHERVIGTRSRNLDTFFVEDEVLKYLFSRTANGTDISLVEGVMGFYDGKGIATLEGSSHDISCKLDMPVILVVNCKGASLSCLPIIKGFLEYTENNIKGVILNNMSSHVYSVLAPKIENELKITVIGHVPKVSELVLESRHLGLVMPSEIDSLKEKLNLLADVLEKHLDVDKIIQLAESTSEINADAPVISKMDKKIKIGFAMDDAFCFNYGDNISLLEEIGAELIPFSPINDKELPEGISGLILSGGYPELHAKNLSNNVSMKSDIKNKISGGMPCMAECGGFMYLHTEMEDKNGKFWKMADVISGKTCNVNKLTRFGYVSLESEDKESILYLSSIKGHEFHYWDSEDCGSSWEATKTSGKQYRCVHETTNGLVVGFPHLYYYSNPQVPYNFLMKCENYKNKK